MPISLPMSTGEALNIIDQAIAILGVRFSAPAARLIMLAIALQESGLRARVQVGGPARGLWQFEPAGVEAVLTNQHTQSLAKYLCAHRGAPTTTAGVYAVLLVDDILAAGFARLMLWADSRPLPEIGDSSGSADLYRRAWGVGKYRPADWPGNYQIAFEAFGNH